ncbi:hypothetical protein LHK_00926 [Laribacter hongkongensis HLHK9]|uniref:Uncharacterized protein n=1 Tax=Laribacter hongkongensis (strain HLHK9) TaxID=557598 RepID=C1D5A1_LARHH|nr:hypothetical protein LHK_00926 [Laribacter hongkongensis HLHK9]
MSTDGLDWDPDAFRCPLKTVILLFSGWDIRFFLTRYDTVPSGLTNSCLQVCQYLFLVSCHFYGGMQSVNKWLLYGCDGQKTVMIF